MPGSCPLKQLTETHSRQKIAWEKKQCSLPATYRCSLCQCGPSITPRASFASQPCDAAPMQRSRATLHRQHWMSFLHQMQVNDFFFPSGPFSRRCPWSSPPTHKDWHWSGIWVTQRYMAKIIPRCRREQLNGFVAKVCSCKYLFSIPHSPHTW